MKIVLRKYLKRIKIPSDLRNKGITWTRLELPLYSSVDVRYFQYLG